MRTFQVTMATVAAVALASGCSAPDPESLFINGESDVGFTQATLTYDSPGRDDARTLSLQVWYPAELSGEAAATYRVANIVTQVSDTAFEAPNANSAESYPVVVYSHGSGGEGLLGYPLGEHMASHGWIVVAPDHAGNTTRDALDGTWQPFIRTVVDRPLDITATLDAVDAGLVAGLQADMDRVMLVGHSFGGYTALAVGGGALDTDGFLADCVDPPDDEDGSCAVLADAQVEAAMRAGFGDDRVDVIVPQAPALVPNFLPGSLAAIEIPTLLQSGERDRSTTHQAQAVPAWNGLDDPRDTWINLPDGGHYSFVTICDDLKPSVLNLFRPDAVDDGCNDTFTPVSVTVPTLIAYAHAFANVQVLEESRWDGVISTEAWRDGFEVTVRGE